MAVDTREDAGEFYPGGKVIPRTPVTPGGGGDMYHSEFSDLDPETTPLAEVIERLKGTVNSAVLALLSVCLSAASIAGVSVTPVYTNHNRVAGNVKTMTNIVEWASAIETAIDNCSSIDTNTVKAIIENEVGGTNTLVHSLSPAIDYTTAVSNDFHVAVTNLAAVKRDITNNVCAATTYSSWTFSGDVQSDETYEVVEEEGQLEYEGKFFYRLYINGVDRWNDGYFDEKQTHLNANIDFESTRYIVCNKYKTSTSGQPFVTYDNVPSTNGFVTASVTNGLCSVAAAQAMTNDATIVRGELSENELEWYMSRTITAGHGCGFGALNGWESYWAGGGYETLPDYLASLVWHPTDATLAQYGITDAYTKAQTETASTNAATSVVSNHLDYALAPLSGTTVNLASGEIGNLSLTSAQTALTVNLDFSAAADRSGDCLLYLINAADTSLDVGPASSVTPIGYTASEAMKAGTNLVMFTRLAYDGGKSVINVAIKEVK